MILWGPLGMGKTMLAEIMAQKSGALVRFLSAVLVGVLVGVKDIRDVVKRGQSKLRIFISRQFYLLLLTRFTALIKLNRMLFYLMSNKGTITRGHYYFN
ncbi:AAA family ATPase [Coxiella-like endosymbiont of Rhipicephalus sanguineus]|uniref:AAA family ATPase n=1 Tax=Coxiella-like endosymbiont of Rhipicephalus sanguineus TaxID=1955402 RepID=UPI0027E1BE4C|nr:AAA family ATPase [Coxiella-like endosymbiont of Rhipicephalus sanguineus]